MTPADYPIEDLYVCVKNTAPNKPLALWLHGWGVDHKTLLPLARMFDDQFENHLIDLPGFGKSPIPAAIWGSREYAALISAYLDSLSLDEGRKVCLIGHSFGCRVAFEMALADEERFAGLIIIGGHGLKKQRSVRWRLRAFGLRLLGKAAKRIDALCKTELRAAYSNRFGSADYRKAGALRPIFLKVIHEDLAPRVSAVTPPVLLIYGAEDNETPPEFGQRYHNLLPQSQLHILPRQDHYTLLSSGRHQVANIIDAFINA